MKDPQAEAQVFLYDLANLAREHWFKPGENWALSLANETEKAALEKQYQPILYITGETASLQKVAELMRTALRQPEPEPETVDERRARRVPPTYLIAYNPDRERK
jgi:hypothetical protein